ncbi:sulfotransferase family protein [Paenibacillus sedimenti]|uniref:Sulfotransferase n=1 Tax=Paenibacillus sedimenti TaxID=2770274 RepID=A0A926KL13_9BACL|nr:sulfotransferase [Paenibacillus sedimenti]MBD0379744.1 sulfotransferase [Paenibacillus sedimenti]
MIDAQGNNLIFLLCAPRSGSSLATVMLQNHSKVFATQEMWYLMSLYDLKNNPLRPYGGMGIIKQFYNAIVPNEVFEQACRSFSLQIYNGLLQGSGADLVVDKSPRYYYILEFLDKLFPQSKRIWLIRNPFSILSSYKKVYADSHEGFNLADELYNPQFNIKMTDLTAGMFRYYDYFSESHPLAYRLFYEQMVSKPEEEMHKLCTFLGISYEQGIEKYGNPVNSVKSDMFYSMGVGDPLLANHTEPHLNSIHNWKEVLQKNEVEMYGRVLGARLFHQLGYSEQLAEAEKWVGVKFDDEPDQELLQLRTTQLAEVTGCKWQAKYRMQSEKAGIQTEPDVIHNASVDSQVFQLQTTLRALEMRLENSYLEQKRLRKQLDTIRNKVNLVKSLIPFGHRITHWASDHLIHRRRKP